MADIKEIISKEAISGIEKTDKGINSLDINLKKFVETLVIANAELKKGGISFKTIADSQKQTTENTKTLTEEQKKLLAIEKQVNTNTDKVVRARVEAAAKTKEQKQRITELVQEETKEIGTLQRLANENKKLVSERSRLNLETKKGQDRLKEINTKLDQNNTKIKENSDLLGKQKINVGNYSSALDKLKGSFALVAIGIAAVVGAFSKLSGYISSSIDKTDVQQLAEVSLATALGFTSKAILDQASSLQTLTRFGDEEIIRGQSFLAQMGLTEAQILKVTPSILDFAQAKGVDLKTASDLVAKSIGSETNALSRYGIQIEGAVGSNERLESALGALNSKFEGQAQAALVGKGALIQLGNTWGDLLERVGKYITDGINPAIRAINSWLTVRDKESKSLINQKAELNTLVLMITDVNTSQAVRKSLIDDLQKVYPNFLKNLDAEKVSNEEIASRLVAVNEQYKTKIAQTLLDEELKKVNKEIAETYKDEYDNLKLLQERKARDNAYTAQNVMAIEDNIRGIKSRREEREKERQEIIKNVSALFELKKATDFFDAPTTKTTNNIETKKTKAEAEVKIIKKKTDDIEKLEEDLNSFIEDMQDGFMDSMDAQATKEIELVKDKISKEQELLNASYAKKLKDEEALAREIEQLKLQLISESVAATFDIIASGYERQFNELQTEKERELALVEGNKAAEDAINEKYAKKEAELKTKAAKAAKAGAMITAATNTALAIVSAYSTPPAPVGIALGVLMAALGAVQIATIAAQPIPKFFKGTDSAPSGNLIAGDRGRELISTTSGQLLMANKPTVMSGLEGAKIYTNKETEAIMRGKVGYDSIDLKGVIDSNRAVERAIKNIPRVQIDRSNRTITERSGSYAQKYLNAKVYGI